MDQLYKKNFGPLVARLARRYNCADITLIEDIVQDTFLVAQQQWPRDDPRNPSAWLYKVSANIASKKIQTTTALASFPVESDSDWPTSAPADIDDSAEVSIEFLTICASLPFSPKQQIIFALRYAASFKISQIAFVLGTSAETISKILQRIKSKIKMKTPSNLYDAQVKEEDRLTVLKILYLMFNEGYKTSRGEEPINETLCADAFALTQSIVNNPKWSSKESKALLALMLYNLARFDARYNTEGEIVDLEAQNRANWNHDMIRVGNKYLKEAQKEDISTYHLEATIAYLHCAAPSFAETDWPAIIRIYEQLAAFNKSPFVRLSLGIAQFYSGQTLKALRTLQELGSYVYINNYYIYHTALGKIFYELGDREQSLAHLQQSLTLATSPIEKRHIDKIIRQISKT
ncbi:MAG: sigma-70 family RNA polymerase sigma factor [Cyclobacteriaceae bacterium]